MKTRLLNFCEEQINVYMTSKQNNCRINSKPEGGAKVTKASFYHRLCFYTGTHYFPVFCLFVSFCVVLRQVNYSIKVYNIKYQLQIHKLIFDGFTVIPSFMYRTAEQVGMFCSHIASRGQHKK